MVQPTAITETQEPENLTRHEAASFLRVSVRTVDYWVSCARGRKRVKRAKKGGKLDAKRRVIVPITNHRLPHFKCGKRVLFKLDELRRFREEMRRAA
jgi:hypothetical protein